MKKFLQKYGLIEDQLKTLLEAYQKDHPEAKELPEYIGKSRFDEVNGKLKTSEGEATTLKKQIEDLQKGGDDAIKAAVKAKEDELNASYQKEIDAINKGFATDTAIMKAHGKNAKAIKALIDPEKDLDKEIERLQKDADYLFESEIPGGTGKQGNGKQGDSTEAELKEMRDAVGVY